MNCPKCSTLLVKKYYKGMFEVEYCPDCRGMWLDYVELDRLEDVAFDKDEFKGSLVHREARTDFHCPHCGERLQEFQYRLYSLSLEYCADGHHGFWLDEGEGDRVLEIMRRRAEEISRKQDAESEWRRLLKGLHQFLKRS